MLPRHLSITSPLPLEECERRIRDSLDPAPTIRWFGTRGVLLSARRLRGRWLGCKFELQRQTWTTNAMREVLVGELHRTQGGTLLVGSFQLPRVAPWVGGLAFLAFTGAAVATLTRDWPQGAVLMDLLTQANLRQRLAVLGLPIAVALVHALLWWEGLSNRQATADFLLELLNGTHTPQASGPSLPAMPP